MEVDSVNSVDSTRPLMNIWLMFRIIGVHPPSRETLWGRYYGAYSIVWNVTFQAFLWVSFFVNFLLSDTMEKFCESFCVTMPHTLYLVKVWSVYRMRRRLLHNMDVLRHLDGQLNGLEEAQIICEGVAKSEFIFRFISRALSVVVTLGILSVAMASERTLVYPTWIPWNWKDSSRSVYLATVVYHITALITTNLLVISVFTYPGTYLILVSAHTKALAFRVARLGRGRPRPPEQVEEQLVGCIRDHHVILHLFKSLEQSISLTCFLQFLCTASAQCAISYFLMFQEVRIMTFINMLGLLFAFTSETLLLCFTAEILAQEGEGLLAAVYSCNWLDQSLRFRRMLVMMLMRCQKPMTLVSQKTVPINFKTFMMMIKGAYTMLTLLNEMRKKSLD
ncbi:putative odorant receptor 19b [Drosophila ficusphila]|uniref:putative odorant receptor 19b n=1 Tax=Drosophila ficusphila TaxID=30025 RepID=UPI0007E82450|nr:putative odorant receptor 19b [Drosophila ficusphila]